MSKKMTFPFVTAISLILVFLISACTCPRASAAEIGKQSPKEIKVITTTEQAIAYTFYGIAKESAVNDVLARLNKLGIKATFFVAEVEMKRYPQTLRKIINNGHEIGIAIRPKAGETLAETTNTIIRSRNMLKQKFGISTNLVKQSSGPIADTTKEAVAASNCVLIGQTVNVVQSKHKDYTSADAVMSEIFGQRVFSLARGQIVHFRMDFYTNERLIAELVEIIKKRKIDNIAYATSIDNPANNPANDSKYIIKPVGQILSDTQFLYQYPVDPQTVPEHLRPGGLSININNGNFLSEASKRYIGEKNVNYEDRMLGFSKMEERRLDKRGCIHTDDNVIFLTFDDWGLDASVNKLLYVLRKHNVTGMFFVLTNNVPVNPNLLRAIALEGHEVGSHTDKHKPMNTVDPKTGRIVKVLSKEEYRHDVTTAYRKLVDVIGDVSVNGKPALTRYFRPPQLAISKEGFETLLEAGYEYIINGSTSTNDYSAQNITEMVKTLEGAIYTEDGELIKGAILVMHMSDTAIYTAMALDILLTANDAKEDSDPTKFRIGRLSDYLKDGYSQMNKKIFLSKTR